MGLICSSYSSVLCRFDREAGSRSEAIPIGVHSLDVANGRPFDQCLRIAVALARKRFGIQEEAEGRDYIERLTKRAPRHVDVPQPDIARTARAGEHGLGYVDAHHLREMFSRNVGDAARPAGKVEAFLLGAAQSPQGCFDQGFFEFGPERGVITR
jgi:hypothetical protein